MKNWNNLIKERNSRTDRPIKPQYIADILSDELEDNAIISVDSGTYHHVGCSPYQSTKRDEIFCFWNTSFNGMWFAVCNCSQIAFPDRQSVAFVGDGGFIMLMGEFATAVPIQSPNQGIYYKE